MLRGEEGDRGSVPNYVCSYVHINRDVTSHTPGVIMLCSYAIKRPAWDQKNKINTLPELHILEVKRCQPRYLLSNWAYGKPR